MKRIEKSENVKRESVIKGTLLVKGDEIIRSSFENYITSSVFRGTENLLNMTQNFVRSMNTSDEVEFVRVDFKKKKKRDYHYQLVMTVEDDFRAAILHKYLARGRYKKTEADKRDPTGYSYKIKKNEIFPTLDE